MSIYQNFIVALFCILIFQGSLLGCPRSRPVGPTEETENKVGQRSTDTISGPMSGWQIWPSRGPPGSLTIWWWELNKHNTCLQCSARTQTFSSHPILKTGKLHENHVCTGKTSVWCPLLQLFSLPRSLSCCLESYVCWNIKKNVVSALFSPKTPAGRPFTGLDLEPCGQEIRIRQCTATYGRGRNWQPAERYDVTPSVSQHLGVAPSPAVHIRLNTCLTYSDSNAVHFYCIGNKRTCHVFAKTSVLFEPPSRSACISVGKQIDLCRVKRGWKQSTHVHMKERENTLIPTENCLQCWGK